VKGHNGKVLSAEEHHRLLQAVARKFAEEGLDAIRLAPPDVGSGRNVRTYLSPLLADPFLRPRIAAASYHLYGKGAQDAVSQIHRQELEAWMTEFWLQQDAIDLNIFSALKSGTSWYLGFGCDKGIFPDGTRSFGYYNLRHFTRFIDFPSRYLASSANSTQLQVAAFQHPASGRLGVVVGNTGAVRKVETELRNIEAVSQMYAYQTGGDKGTTFLGIFPVTENKVTFDAPTGSLTTLVSTPSAGNDTPVAILRPSENPLVTVGLPVKFRADQSFDNNGDPLSYSWDFGDGSSSPKMNPVHMFSQLGSIRVTLTVTDDKGAKSTVASTVTIEEQLPSAPPTLTVMSPRTDQAVDTEAIITWSDEDSDSDARITWFYDTDDKNFDGTRICSLFYENFESGSLEHWLPWKTPWTVVADPGKPGNRVVSPQGVNSYLVLKKNFGEDVVLSVRQYGLGGPSLHFSNLLEAPASYRIRGNVLLSKRPGNLTLLRHYYDHSNVRWYWREIEARDRNYDKTRGVALRGEILDSEHRLLSRVLYHDLGSFGYVPATRDRGAAGIALYGYGEPGEYFDDVCVDAIAARSEDDETDRLVWDTSNVAAGAYYIYAIIADRENMVRRYSSGRIIVRHENGVRAPIMNPDRKRGVSQGVSHSQRKRLAW
jgi:PKD repeat protein